MSLAPAIEAGALRETEDALRELVKVAQNIGCRGASIAMMLRAVAEEIEPLPSEWNAALEAAAKAADGREAHYVRENVGHSIARDIRAMKRAQ